MDYLDCKSILETGNFIAPTSQMVNAVSLEYGFVAHMCYMALIWSIYVAWLWSVIYVAGHMNNTMRTLGHLFFKL